jgi:hypothetical protein
VIATAMIFSFGHDEIAGKSPAILPRGELLVFIFDPPNTGPISLWAPARVTGQPDFNMLTETPAPAQLNWQHTAGGWRITKG